MLPGRAESMAHASQGALQAGYGPNGSFESYERGKSIGGFDMLIAAQALTRGLILITRNLREFRRVTGLQMED
jgi:hypothetical protein